LLQWLTETSRLQLIGQERQGNFFDDVEITAAALPRNDDGVLTRLLVHCEKGREHEHQDLEQELEQKLDQRDWRRREISTCRGSRWHVGSPRKKMAALGQLRFEEKALAGAIETPGGGGLGCKANWIGVEQRR
jgi:hypothetical protein